MTSSTWWLRGSARPRPRIRRRDRVARVRRRSNVPLWQGPLTLRPSRELAPLPPADPLPPVDAVPPVDHCRGPTPGYDPPPGGGPAPPERLPEVAGQLAIPVEVTEADAPDAVILSIERLRRPAE